MNVQRRGRKLTKHLGVLLIGAPLIVGMGVGCAAPFVKPTDRISNESAYFYGNFSKTKERFGGDIVLEIKGVGKGRRDYRISLPSDEPSLRVIKVQPGDYALKGYAIKGSGAAGKANISPAEYTGNFSVDPGSAYYIGDFHGRVSSLLIYAVIAYAGKVEWQIDPIKYDFTAATNALGNGLPNLAALPCQPAFQEALAPANVSGG